MPGRCWARTPRRVRDVERREPAALRLVVVRPGPRRRAGPRSRAPAAARRQRTSSARPSATSICSSTRSTPGDHLGDRVLDLEAGVHLQEEEPLGVGVVEELDRAGAAVADRLGRPSGGVVQRVDDLGARPGAGASSTTFWWRRCTEQSRSPSTSTWPLAVADHLDLDVPAALDVRLDEDGAVAEGGRRLGLGGRDLGGQVLQRADDPHAAAAAAGGRLDQQRQVRLGRLLGHLQGRHAGLAHQLLGLDLGAHRLDRLRRRADPGEPGRLDGAGEVGVLGQEAVAGVDRVGARCVRGRVERRASTSR